MSGRASVYLVDKPVGPTSREVLDALEKRLCVGALGHAGTLDPLAGGLLVVLTGEARRLQDLFMGSSKVYETSIRFGAWSASDDAEGPITPGRRLAAPFTEDSARALFRPFVGTYDQLPPQHSAVRVGGRRAHALARAGEVPALRPRRVAIHAIDLLDFTDCEIHLRVHAGPGTYIRSLARDLGAATGAGAYVTRLRRVRSGPFSVEDAHPPDRLTAAHALAIETALQSYPALVLQRDEAESLRHGRVVLTPRIDAARTIAWWNGIPLCRLADAGPGIVRSQRWIADPKLFMPSSPQ